MAPLGRCVGIYRPNWETAVRCGLTEHHKGAHGPSKPALAQEHSETSKQAARAIEPVRGSLKARVQEAITLAGGLSDEQGIAATGIAASTYRPRRIELVEAGTVIDSGRFVKTASGRQAVVWVSNVWGPKDGAGQARLDE